MSELANHYLKNDANLVTYIKFEGSSADSKGSNSGTDTSITYSVDNGRFGQGAGFNGTTSKIVITDSASLELATGTISFWWKPTSTLQATLGAVYYIIDKGNTYIGCEISVNGTMRFRIYDGSTHDCTTTQSIWIGGTWYHVALQWGSSGQKILINGKVDGTNAGTGGYTNTVDNWFLMNNGATYSSGSIDEFAVFSRALTLDEILDLYNSHPINRIIRPRPFAPGNAR